MSIDPFEQNDGAALAIPVAARPEPGLPMSDAQVDDSAERAAILDAPASARLLVEAGPGTGKTEMAAKRLARLIRTEISPGQILVLSFSRSAVRTLTRRLTRVGETDPGVVEELRHLSIRTFDSWAFRMLRLLGEPPRALLARGHDENIAQLTKVIGSSRREALRSLIGDRRHIIVDEFQDLPGVRGDLVLALLSLLAPPRQPGCGFTILGDPAQAIYGFARGRREDGTPFPSPQQYWKQVIGLYGDELEEVALRRNYRAHSSLAQLSAELRAVLLSDRPEEDKLRFMMEAVAALPAPAEPLGRAFLEGNGTGSRAILTRTNGEALRVLQRLFGRELQGPRTPIRLRAGGYATLPPAWIGALLRKLRSSNLPRSQFGRIHDHLTSIWGEETCRRLSLPDEDVAWARLARASGAAEETTAIDLPTLRAHLSWPDAFPDDQPVGEDGLIVTTVHQSKGMEFDIVTMLDAPAEEDDDDPEDEDAEHGAGEEASVAYVAVTRAGRTLERIPASQIYQPPTRWRFNDGRERLCCWRKGWINMEMGIRGDIDPFGFADPQLLGGPDGVEELQAFLLAEAGRLEGRQVMLCKEVTDGKAIWLIRLQDENGPGRIIGRTAQQLTYDLLKVLHSHGYSLPRTILNLRISSVGTITGDGGTRLAEPERTSGLWLGVGLFGTGDFKTWKGNRR